MNKRRQHSAVAGEFASPATGTPATSPGTRKLDASRTGTVLSIQRMSTDDGPGLRTTVFLKGCSLACEWCHNPESIAMRPEIVWHHRRCISARLCVHACPEQALAFEGDTVSIVRDRCTLCGECVDECPSDAFEVLGTTWSAEALAAELARDKAFFERAGGGITISGGEPGLQAPFVGELLDHCRGLGIATAVDTAGLAAPAALLELARRADLVLYDLKHIDSERHHCLTGQPNERILANAEALAALVREEGHPKTLWIRTPLIPGATLDDDNLLGLGAFLADRMKGAVARWELCAFNNLAVDKYERLGLQWPFKGAALLTREELANAETVARRSGVDPSIVVATGPTRTAGPA